MARRNEIAWYEPFWSELGDESILHPGHFTKLKPSIGKEVFAEFLKQNQITGKSLDIGCGNARHSIMLAKQGFETHGFDISESAIETAKQKVKDAGLEVKLFVDSSLDFKSDVLFDVIVDAGCFHHLLPKEHEVYIDNILKISKKGTMFYLSTFSTNTGFVQGTYPKTEKIIKAEKTGLYNHFFSDKDITNLFDKQFHIHKLAEYDKILTPFVFKYAIMERK